MGAEGIVIRVHDEQFVALVCIERLSIIKEDNVVRVF